MPEIPFERGPLLLRVDFSDDPAWVEVRAAATGPTPEGFEADVAVVDDHVFAGLTADDVLGRSDGHPSAHFLFLADATTFATPDHSLLVLGLGLGVRGERFRALPATVQAIENNLS